MIGQATRASTIAAESIGFIGDGRFATALASVLAATDRAAVLYTHDSALRRDINRNHRSRKLPGVSLSKKVAATSDPAELAKLCELIIVALPTTRVIDELGELGGVFGDKHVLAHAVGGLVDGRRGVSSIIREATGVGRTAALAGPALPRDLSARRSCAMVAASASDDVLEFVKSKLHCPPVLRIYKSNDVGGVELSATIASALTVMLGIADGLAIGDGPRTVALTRGVAEGAKLVAASGGNSQTFYGMSGLGNLLVRTFIFSCTASACTEDEKRTTVSFGGQSVIRVDQDSQGTRDPKLLHASGLSHLLAVYTYDRPPSGGIDYTMASAFQYGPFGEILEAASAPNVSTDDFLQRFNGKEYDTESGLSYYGYRYYEPIAQIWNRPDPMYRNSPEAPGADRRGNLYTFSLNNPVRYLDPDGLDARAHRMALEGAYNRLKKKGEEYCAGRQDEGACQIKYARALHAWYQEKKAQIDEIERLISDIGGGTPTWAGRWAESIWGWTKNFPVLLVARTGAKGVLGEWGEIGPIWSDAADAYSDPFERGGPSEKMGKPKSPKGQKNGRECFVAGTLVESERGLLPIEEIEVGDLVWSRSDETGEEGWKPVSRTFITQRQVVLDLDLIEADGDRQELLVTPEHPFWKEIGWAPVGTLLVGDSVWARDGWATVASLTHSEQMETVYNLEVADFNTYFVGRGGVWAHNQCWRTPEEWAQLDHETTRDRLRPEYEGFESGQHNKYPRAMADELTRLANAADARGDLPGYSNSLRRTAATYEKRARKAHRGGAKKGGKRR